MKTKFVIFDMDGLMFDTERMYLSYQENEFARRGINVDMTAVFDVIGTYNDIDYNKLNKSNLPNEEVENILNGAYYSAVDYMIENGPPIKKGLYELLDYLDENNIKYCVATSTPEKISGKFLKKRNLDSRIAFLVTGNMVAKGKPAPDIFLKAAEMAQTNPDDCLILEDSNNGGQAAINAHIPYIIIPDLKQPNEKIANGASGVLNSLLDVIDYLKSN